MGKRVPCQLSEPDGGAACSVLLGTWARQEGKGRENCHRIRAPQSEWRSRNQMAPRIIRRDLEEGVTDLQKEGQVG